MEHNEGTFSGSGGLQLFFQRWKPTAPPRAIIAFIHGIGGHSGQPTYTHLISYLVQSGYALYGMDLRGHGRSPGHPGHINHWSEYRTDVRAFLDIIRNFEPGRPVFLLGQSLGGLIALEYAVRYPEGLRGVIASAPVLTEPKTSPIQRAVLVVLSRLWPHLRLPLRLELSGLSRDHDEVEKIIKDPLTNLWITPRTFRETLTAIQWMQLHVVELRIPLLLIHGTADTLASPDGSRSFFDKVGIADKTLQLYEGGFHQAFIDVNRKQVLTDVAQWLDRHV